MTLKWPDIVDYNLQAAVAAKLVNIQFVGKLNFAHAVVRPVGGIDIKRNTVQQRTTAHGLDHHLQMTLTDQTLLEQTEMPVKTA